MAEARVEPVYADFTTAREYLDQASIFFTDARRTGLDAASRMVLMHNAALAACDALLQACALRVPAGDGAHLLRLRTALAQLEEDTQELFEALDATRERRNEAWYRAGPVAAASLADAEDAVGHLLALVGERLG